MREVTVFAHVASGGVDDIVGLLVRRKELGKIGLGPQVVPMTNGTIVIWFDEWRLFASQSLGRQWARECW